MFEAQIVELLQAINQNQQEIITRIGNLEKQVDSEYVTVREAAVLKGCSVQAIHHHLTHNYELEPEVDWVKRNGKNLIRKVALPKIVIKQRA